MTVLAGVLWGLGVSFWIIAAAALLFRPSGPDARPQSKFPVVVLVLSTILLFFLAEAALL